MAAFSGAVRRTASEPPLPILLTVSLENTPLVKFIRIYIRDPSGVMSISSLARSTSFPGFSLFLPRDRTLVASGHVTPKTLGAGQNFPLGMGSKVNSRRFFRKAREASCDVCYNKRFCNQASRNRRFTAAMLNLTNGANDVSDAGPLDFHSLSQRSQREYGNHKSLRSLIGVRAGGARGAAAPPVLKIFGQNAYDSGKSIWDKFFF